MNWELLLARLVAYAIQGITAPIFYLINSLLVSRAGILDRKYSKRPARSLRIPTSPNRNVKIDIYEPQTPSPLTSSSNGESRNINEASGGARENKQRPVHVNFHGSGFILKAHGSDAEICAYLANALQCTVIDADYAKAPTYPYPAAVDDALNVLAWVASQPHQFDLSKVTVGGFSSGGNIALLAATRLGRGGKDAVKGVVCWYPPTDMRREGVVEEEKKVRPGMKWLHAKVRMTYLPPGVDRASSRVSPLMADSALFPPTTLIVSHLLGRGKEFGNLREIDVYG